MNLHLLINSRLDYLKIQLIEELRRYYNVKYKFKKYYNSEFGLNISTTEIDNFINYLVAKAKNKFQNYFSFCSYFKTYLFNFKR